MRFISSLSCVDGLVLINRDFGIEGFGTVISSENDPKHVYIAGDTLGTSKLLRKINPNHFGTRHRSMMRYCSQIEGSIGFVVSQDGDIRAITKVGDKLILWDNIRVHTVIDD